MAESPLLHQSLNKKLNDKQDSPCRDKIINSNISEKSEKIELSEKLSYDPSTSAKTTSDSIEKMVDGGDVIGNIVGDFGKWQLRAIFLIFLVKIPSSWFMACIIYTAPAPKHGDFFCKPPSYVTLPNRTQWIKITHPVKEEVEDKEFNIDFCNVYEDAKLHSYNYFKNEHTSPWELPKRNSNIIPCESFEHTADYSSVITDFDLVCSRDILVSVTQFFHLFGVLWGGIIATRMLETISPKNVMLIGMYSQIACGNICGLINVFELHMLFRTASAICCGLMYTAGGVIFSDITGGRFKISAICLFEQFWSIGVILLPGVASFWSSWSQLYMAISMPTFVLVFLHRWIPDSPRWLVKRGRIRETKDILIESAKMNGKSHVIPRDLEHQLKLQAAAALEEPIPPPWWSIWKEKDARVRLVACHLSWSIYIIVYYGMLLNIRAFGREHLEINTVIAGICEIIGTFMGLYLILCTSRKWIWTGILNVIGGLIAYLAWYIPPQIQGNQRVAVLMLTAMVSKITISCTLSILTTCTTELVIHEKRKAAAYSTIVWARFWLLGAPFIGATSVLGQLIPQTALGTMTIIGGFITCLITSPRTVPKPKTNYNYPNELTIPEIWTTKAQQEKVGF